MVLYRNIIFNFKIIISVLFLLPGCILVNNDVSSEEFDGQRAFEDIQYQLKLGPRIQGSEAHQKTIEWIESELKDADWDMEIQQGVIGGITVKNVIAKRGEGEQWIILGSHYDSRPKADQEQSSEKRNLPVPGANDGASSVAVLLEIGRVLSKDIGKQIWLVFFDAEDLSSNALAVGSQYFVDQLQIKPDGVVVLDMIGDKDLNINMEWNSDQTINQEIWNVATELGYTQFIPAYKYTILDDHIPFIKAGINAVDIIDFDYPYWHTTQDTLDKVSAESLNVVGDTIIEWLETYPK
jgi:Zn-dependent M28 family amino/carboxypeptidase